MPNVDTTKAKSLFLRALEHPPDERDAFLGKEAGYGALRRTIDRLLEAHENAGESAFLKTGPLPLAPVRVTEGPGSLIGRYKLLQQIGEGGFGVVYMAEQVRPVRRRVALKIIKLGMDSKQVIARFEAERQALAMMDHPHIAKVFDAGTTETGRPYFVMELVKGVPITEYCDRAKLSIDERLALVLQVCGAIQHSHQKGVIHRDIKPTNVMVTLHDGVAVPKVIDFGIAKATDRSLTERTLFTEYAQVIGTPEYMSPEQAEMSGLDVDTRADIYSLGVLLYELLTGTQPFDLKTLLAKGYGELLRTIREVDPPRPSTRISSLGRKAGVVAKKHHTTPAALGKLLSGDLDWIVMKALEKDRTRRYETAAAMAADIERHLGHRPVEASPPSNAYKLKKFVVRNRPAVLAACLVAVALLSGAGAALAGFLEAGRARDEALDARDEVAKQRDEIRAERDAAERAREQERKERLRADAKTEEARTERDAKDRALLGMQEAMVRADGARLLAEAKALLTEEPSLALLLAIEGAQRLPGLLGNDLLLTAMDGAPERELILTGHEGMVVWMDLTRDGSRVVTASWDGTARIWDARSGELLHTLDGGEKQTISASFSRDGGLLLTHGKDGAARIWDARSGSPLHTLEGHRSAVMHSEFSNDGRLVVTGGDLSDRTIRVWNAETGELLQHLAGLAGWRGWFNPASKRLLTVHEGWYALRQAETGELVRPLEKVEHRLAFNAIGFSPNGRFFVAGVNDEPLALVFDGHTGALQRSLEGVGGPLQGAGIAFSQDGRRVILRFEGSVGVWDLASGERLAHWETEGRGFKVATNSDGSRVLAMDGQETLLVWDVESGRRLHTIRTGSAQGWAMALSPDGQRVYAGGKELTLRIWEPSTGRERTGLEGHEGGVMGMSFSPDGRRVASADGNSLAHVWDVDTRERLEFRHHGKQSTDHVSNWVNWVEFSPDGSHVVVAGMNSHVFICDSRTGEKVRLLDHDEMVWTARYSPDGSQVLTVCEDDTATLWSADTGEVVATFGEPIARGNNIMIGAVGARFSPDGRYVITRLKDPFARVWHAGTGALVHTLGGHDEPVVHASYSANGAVIVTSSKDGTRVWDGATGELIRAIEEATVTTGSPLSPDGERMVVGWTTDEAKVVETRTGDVLHLLPSGMMVTETRFSADGRFVLVGTSGSTLLWDATTGAQVATLPRGQAACLSPDSSTVALGTSPPERLIRLFPVDPLAAAIARKPRELTVAERKRYGLDPPAD